MEDIARRGSYPSKLRPNAASPVSPPTGAATAAPQYAKYADLIGNTPLIDLSEVVPNCPPDVTLLGKCEFLNPGFSVKDRIVRHIFNKAEAAGKLRPGATVVAASSGNTGASTAMLCAMRGYKCVITTDPKCSKEKCDSIRSYGAELIVTASGLSADHPDQYMNLANRLAKENPDWFDVDQYENLDNPAAHYSSLGPEIWEQTNGTVTHFVAAGSTGGTVSGTGRFLKEQNSDVRVLMADPTGSIFKTYYETGELTKPGKYLVEGVGKGNIPGTMDFKVVDSMVEVHDREGFHMCRRLAATTGLMVGGSAGLNVAAAVKIAEQCTGPATIVTVLCDLGVKYLSKVYNDDWLVQNDVDWKESDS